MAEDNKQPEYLNRSEAARYQRQKYGTGSVSTLAKLASTGGGPRYVVFGGRALYTKAWLDEWFCATARIRSNTSEEPQTLAKANRDASPRAA